MIKKEVKKMSEYPKIVMPQEVVNSIFGGDLFSAVGGRVKYDEVWMSDGGHAVYLSRVAPMNDGRLKVTRRWIDWNTPLIQFYDPTAPNPK